MRTEFGVDSRLMRLFAGLGLSLGLVLGLLFTVVAVLDGSSLIRALLLVGSGILIPIVAMALAALVIAAFRIRLIGDKVQYVALGKFVLSQFPICQFEGVAHFPPEIRFTHRRRIALLGMHPQTLDELEVALRERVREAGSGVVVERGGEFDA